MKWAPNVSRIRLNKLSWYFKMLFKYEVSFEFKVISVQLTYKK